MTEKRKSNFFILAGTSGTGKTSVLKQLRDSGFSCVDEMARNVLSHQLASDGPALPSKDPMLFIQTMMNQCLQDYQDSSKISASVFFDRGMPDLVHYAIRFGVDQTDFLKASKQYLYNPNVFVFEPWEEIFVNDTERRMTFAKSVEFHEILVHVYQELGYELIQVPRGSVQMRSNFILNHLNDHKI